MTTSLTEFKLLYHDRLLDFVWREWSAMGVAGSVEDETRWIMDPEALLLFSCSVARSDARVFDEVLDWLQTNGRFINVLRLKRLQQTEQFAGTRVLAAIAGHLCKGTDAPKWKQLAVIPPLPATLEPLLFFTDGKPLPVIHEPEPHFARYGLERGPLRLRGYSRKFRPLDPTNLTLQLRALVGNTARAEILTYLLTHDAAHPSEIARCCAYHERAIQATLAEMSQSGVIQIKTTGREKHYWIKSGQWWPLLNRAERHPRWVTWAPLFRALEQIWIGLDDPRLPDLEPLMQASLLRQLMLKVLPAIERAGFDKVLSDDRHYLAEAYLPVFLSDITKLLDSLQ